jgi:hypothetical protein
MKFLMMILCSLAVWPIFGEMVGYVEYSLPKMDQEWVVLNKMDDERGVTIIYIPKDIPKEVSNEFFGVNFNKLPSDLKDTDSIKSSFQQMFRDADVEFAIVEEEKESLLMEVIIKAAGGEKVHVFSKAFSNEKGTVVLSLTTGNIANLSSIRSAWLAALKEVKVLG